MRARQKPFVVERGRLPARRKERELVVVESIDPRRADQRRRDKRVKALALQAFRNWKPGI